MRMNGDYIMTVKEFINELQKIDNQNATVYVYDMLTGGRSVVNGIDSFDDDYIDLNTEME